MAYLARQRITVASEVRQVPVVLLAALDRIFGQILASHLESEFTIVTCDYSGVIRAIQEQRPHVTVFDTEQDIRRLALLRTMLSQFPEVPVITTSTTVDELFLDQLMGLGVRGHVNRKFSRPQDIAVLIKETMRV